MVRARALAGRRLRRLFPSVDRAALVALFEATNGPMWNSAENWLTDAPLREWYGVVDGRPSDG